MDYPLISVIVPIYKVEPYIHRCVDSILNQTYSNLEIILVDDGSPDNCGKICDEYAKKDYRIVVIHRENGGLSAARNSGLDICNGEYIGFVDSDDFICPEMYEQLYNDIVKYGTKLAFCHTNVYRNGIIIPKDYGEGSECFTKEYVMRRALTESIWWSAWTKLYHRSLFNNIRFPEGKTNEDLAIMMRIYDQCDKIVINYNKLHNYWIREGSITTTNLNSHKFDIVDNALDVASFLHDTHPLLEPAAKAIALSSSLNLLSQIYHTSTNAYELEKKNLYANIKKEWPSLLTNSNLTWSQRILLTAAATHPEVLKISLKLRKHILG